MSEPIEASRESLERLADSDLPAAWVAEALLDAADTEAGG